MKQNLKICLLFLCVIANIHIVSARTNRQFALAIFAVQDSLQEVVSIDPSQLDITPLENFLKTDDSPVQQSVTHLLLSQTKNYMSGLNINNRDREKCDTLRAQAERHLSRVLDDMPALMKAKAADFDSLLTIPKDNESFSRGEAYYDGDLLHVLVRYVAEQDYQKRDSIYALAEQAYLQAGNKNAAILMSMPKILSQIDNLRYSNSEKAAVDMIDSLLIVYKDFPPMVQQLNYKMYNLCPSRAAIYNLSILPNTTSKLAIECRNIDDVTLTIRNYAGKDSKRKYLETGAVRYQRTFLPKYSNRDKRVEPDTVYADIKLPAGEYIAILSGTKSEKQVAFFHITSLGIIALNLNPPHKTMAVDIITGRPNKKATFENDPGNKSRCRAKLSKTDYTEWIYLWNQYDAYQQISKNANLYTNRNLYRPGQTVHVVGLVWTQNPTKEEATVSAKKQVSVVIRDPKYNKVFEKKLTTNAYGTIDFDYTLPADAELGNYRISLDNINSRSFQVAEYKRPSFEVTAKGVCKDSIVTFSGEVLALSGAPMQNATVHYTLSYQPFFYRYYRNNIQSVTIDGDCTTDKDGKFIVKDSLKHILSNGNPDYYYIALSASVTSLSGETQETSAYTYIQFKPYNLAATTPSIVNLAEQNTITINAFDAESKNVAVNGKYQLECNEKVYQKAAFESSKPISLPANLPSGEYKLTATTDIDTLVTIFNIFNASSQKAYFTTDFCYSPTNGLIDKGVDIYVAPQEKDCYVFVFVSGQKGLVDSTHVIISSGMKHIHLPYKSTWGKAINVRLAYIRNGRSWQSDEFSYEIPQPNFNLSLALTTFRNHTTPGSKEEWTLQVLDNKQKPIKAELAATLYDAALDRISSKNSWNLWVSFYRPVMSLWSMNIVAENYAYNMLSTNARTPSPIVDPLNYASWNGFNLSPHSLMVYNDMVYKSSVQNVVVTGMGVKQSALQRNAVMDMVAEADYEMAVAEEAAVPSPMAAKEASIEQDISAFLRKDFSEDALWMPHFYSNDNGEAQISFTMPDALTEWRLLVLAHTADMQHASLDTTITVSKTIMLQPMWPRFVRQNDSIVFGATAMNRTAQMMDATAMLEIRSADSTTVLNRISMPVTLYPDSSMQIVFPMKENLWGDSVIATMAIAGEKGGDGEQIYIPVLAPEVKDTGKVVSTRLAPEEEIKKAVENVKAPKLINAMDCALAIYINHEKGKSTVAAETKLRALQKADGSFAWCPGMQGDYYITLSVAEMLERSKGIMTKELKKALNWLDAKELESYRRQIERKQPFAISESTIHYLLLSARVGNNLSEEVKTMQQAYLKEIEKSALTLTNKREARRAAFSIYGVANLADMFILQDKTKPADACLYHLKHYSVYREGFGRYYATDQAQYSWMDYKLPTQLAAIQALLEAKAANYKDKDLTQYSAEMLLWVLRQTQTQQWENPLNILLANELVKNTKTTDVGAEWQYLLDNTENPIEGSMQIERYFTTDTMQVGDRVTLRTRITTDRDMDFVKVTIPLPACMEPTEQLSGYRWLGGAYGYVSQHDDHVDIYLNHFRTGACTLDIDYFVVRDGSYSMPEAQVVCTYNPIFRATTPATVTAIN